MVKDAAYWIEKLNLTRHPEGGYFRQTYRSRETIAQSALPGRFSDDRPISTAIYYLLGADEFSAFHSIKSDEVWHFYFGAALTIHIIDQNRKYSRLRLGNESDRGEVFQAVVEAGCWFGATADNSNDPTSGYLYNGSASVSAPAPASASVYSSADPHSACSPAYSLVGCTVAPGFDFSDFRLGDRADLIERYPEHQAIIEKLTH
jgi:hypothetical protein